MSFINLFKQLLSISVILFSQESPAVDCLYISLFSSSQAELVRDTKENDLRLR